MMCATIRYVVRGRKKWQNFNTEPTTRAYTRKFFADTDKRIVGGNKLKTFTIPGVLF